MGWKTRAGVCVPFLFFSLISCSSNSSKEFENWFEEKTAAETDSGMCCEQYVRYLRTPWEASFAENNWSHYIQFSTLLITFESLNTVLIPEGETWDGDVSAISKPCAKTLEAVPAEDFEQTWGGAPEPEYTIAKRSFDLYLQEIAACTFGDGPLWRQTKALRTIADCLYYDSVVTQLLEIWPTGRDAFTRDSYCSDVMPVEALVGRYSASSRNRSSGQGAARPSAEELCAQFGVEIWVGNDDPFGLDADGNGWGCDGYGPVVDYYVDDGSMYDDTYCMDPYNDDPYCDQFYDDEPVEGDPYYDDPYYDDPAVDDPMMDDPYYWG